MIRYNLRCERGHSFESWFQSSSAYESQEKRKLVSCPACGSSKVERAIMAPQIVSKKGRESAAPAPAPAASTEVATPSSTPLLMAQERELRAKLRELRDHIVVVTRWYGGVHLGGDRFAHVVTAVRAYLEALAKA